MNTDFNKVTLKRFDYNDIAKAIGMFLIIWGHIYYGSLSLAFVYSFHIPLYFFLSGMVFDKNKYKKFGPFFKRKVKTLLVPYVIFSLITWIIWAFYNFLLHNSVENYWYPLLQTFIAQGSGGYLLHNVPLWFVTCLFVMEMIYYFISDYKVWSVIIAFSLAAISYCCQFVIPDFSAVPWNLDAALLGLPFYAVGHNLILRFGHEKVKSIKINDISIFVFVLLLFVVLGISKFNGAISFGHTTLGRNIFLVYLGGFLGTFMILLCSIMLSNSFLNNVNNVFMNCLKWFGRNCIYAMFIHNPIKGFIIVLVAKIFDLNTL